MPKPLKLDQRLDRFPPILLRLLMTRGRGADKWVLTDEQIADASGLTLAVVKLVSYSLSWDGITHDVRRRFLASGDIDLEKRRTFRRLEHMRRHGCFRHLRKSPLWDGQFAGMLDIYGELP